MPTVPTFVARAHGMASTGRDSELKLTQEQLKSLYGCLLRFQIERGDDVNKRDKDGDTLLYTAITTGHASAVSMLLAAGADVNTAGNSDGVPGLFVASLSGYTNIVSMLLDARAAVDHANTDGLTPLSVASHNGHLSTVRVLLAADADVDLGAPHRRPLFVACRQGHLACVQLLSSYSACRVFQGRTAEWLAEDVGHTTVAEWLASTRLWSTPLHHLSVIEPQRCMALLKAGADLHAAAHLGAAEAVAAPTARPTPLSIARAMMDSEPTSSKGSPAALVLRAAEPWSPSNHDLFPQTARDCAVELLLVGYRLSRERAHGGALLDVWVGVVMPLLLTRNMNSDRPDDSAEPFLCVASEAPIVHVSRRKRSVAQSVVRLLRFGARRMTAALSSRPVSRSDASPVDFSGSRVVQ